MDLPDDSINYSLLLSKNHVEGLNSFSIYRSNINDWVSWLTLVIALSDSDISAKVTRIETKLDELSKRIEEVSRKIDGVNRYIYDVFRSMSSR